MGQTVSGTVEATTKSPKEGYYAMKVGETWYNSKNDLNDFWKAEVEFEVGKKRGDKRSYVKGDITVTAERSKGGGGGGGKGGGYKGKGGGGGGMSPERQAAITWQHSQEMAIQAVTLLHGADAIALGSAAKKHAERATVILDLVDELTCKFFTEVESQEPLKKQQEVDADLEAANDESYEDDDDSADDFDDDDGDWED